MNEIDLLTRLRDEVPLSYPSPDAQRAFRAGLADAAVESAARRPRRHRRPSAHQFRGRVSLMAGVTAVAVGATAGIVVLSLPSGSHPPNATPTGASESTGSGSPTRTSSPTATNPPTGTNSAKANTPMSAQLLADVAASAVLSQPAVKPTQWVYRKIEIYRQQPPAFVQPAPRFRAKFVEDTWTMADGANFYTTGSFEDGVVPNVPYSRIGSLPTDPVALDAYLAHLEYPNPNATTANKATSEFSGIEEMLTSYVLPPKLTAELYHAVADIPTVIAKENVKDIDGQTGVAFILPQNSQSVNQEIILRPSTYQMLASADWETGGSWHRNPQGGWSGPVPFREEAFLAQAFVSASGKLP